MRLPCPYLLLAVSLAFTSLAFTAADSGVGGHRVVFRNYPDEVPVIDGGVPITGWTETNRY